DAAHSPNNRLGVSEASPFASAKEDGATATRRNSSDQASPVPEEARRRRWALQSERASCVALSTPSEQPSLSSSSSGGLPPKQISERNTGSSRFRASWQRRPMGRPRSHDGTWRRRLLRLPSELNQAAVRGRVRKN